VLVAERGERKSSNGTPAGIEEWDEASKGRRHSARGPKSVVDVKNGMENGKEKEAWILQGGPLTSVWNTKSAGGEGS